MAVADASTARWKAGRPRRYRRHVHRHQGPAHADGLRGFPWQFPQRDNASVWALREAGAVIFGKAATAELGGSHIPPTTATFSSLPAAASASFERKSTSLASWPDSGSALKKSTREFGSSASSTMIWAISTWNREPCNPSTTRLGPGCHLCHRYILLPMSPGRSLKRLVAGACYRFGSPRPQYDFLSNEQGYFSDFRNPRAGFGLATLIAGSLGLQSVRLNLTLTSVCKTIHKRWVHGTRNMPLPAPIALNARTFGKLANCRDPASSGVAA